MRTTLLLSLLLPAVTFAQEDFWAIPNGVLPTALYRAADSSSERITLLTSDDALLTRCDGTDWCWAQDQWDHQGWVQRSRITALSAFDDRAAHVWIIKVFKREQRLARKRSASPMGAVTMADPGAPASSIPVPPTPGWDSLAAFPYTYHAALSRFETLYCSVGNPALLRELMHTVANEPGSADEEPPRVLTAALRCRPAEFRKELHTLQANEQGFVREAVIAGISLNYNNNDPQQKREAEGLMKELEKR